MPIVTALPFLEAVIYDAPRSIAAAKDDQVIIEIRANEWTYGGASGSSGRGRPKLVE